MKYIYTLLLVALFTGCGGSSEDSSPQSSQSVVIEMQLNQDYTVYKGDTLVKTSDDAKVSITKNTQEDISTVVLLEGTANIIRN